MKTLFIVIGSICLVLGVIGIVVPLLPTTPFLLLSAALYMRSSPRLYERLLNSKYLGSYIRDYREHRAIPLKSKIIALIVLWGSMTYCIAVVLRDTLWVQITLGVICAAVSWHILSLKNR